MLYHSGYRRDARDALVAFEQWKATAKMAAVEVDDATDAPIPDFQWVAGDPVEAARLSLREDEALNKLLLELDREHISRSLEHIFDA